MSATQQGQVIQSAAEVYEEFFVPALFQEWAMPVAEAAGIGPGQRVLDVACGTGVLAQEAATRAGASGVVIGLDVNPGMLAVARKKRADIEWRHGRAESLPFPDASFDAVISQFGLMFFADRRAAIGEMVRVLRSGGRLAVAVWDSLENTPGYAAVTALLQRLFGNEVADELRAPFALGDKQELHALFEDADLTELAVETRAGTARFPSVASWMHTDVKGWTLADVLDEKQFQLLLQEAERELQPYVTANGTVAFTSPAHLIRARKP